MYVCLSVDTKILQMKYHKIIILFVYIVSICIFTIQSPSSEQNVILLHKKYSKKTYSIIKGKNVKIITIKNEKLKGRITEIKDSTIVIRNQLTNEIPIKNIRYLSFRNSTLGSYGLEAGLIGLSIGFTYTYSNLYTLGNYPTDNPTDKNKGNLILFIGSEATLFAGLGLATNYLLFHKRKFDVKNKWDLLIVKPKKK